MNKILTAGLAALTLGGAVLGAASAASAHEWGGGWRNDDDDDGGGAAVAAGILGLAVGAALSGGDHAYYGPPPAYYGPPAPAYYDGPVHYSYYRHCRVEWRWSPRWGRYERVRACY